MMSTAKQSIPDELSSSYEKLSVPHLVNTAVDYTDNHVNEELHSAFKDSGIKYDDASDQFSDRPDTTIDEKALSDRQQAFSEALAQYEKEADPKFKTGIDLKRTHTWEEVLKQVEKACNEYKGTGEKKLSSIRGGLRSFSTAGPAIELWLKLLPSTTIYGSILCGGLTIILEVSFHLCPMATMRLSTPGGSAAWEASGRHLRGYR